MSDTLVTVVAIFLAAVLMFVFPLITMSDRVDDTSQVSLQSETAKFVQDVTNKGQITKEDYEKFQRKLPTQNTYSIEMEIWILDENPGKKTVQTNSKKIGENVYYCEYTSQIEQKLLDKSPYKITLKEGDMFVVRVKNTNTTMSQQLSPLPSSDVSTLSAESSGMVTVNGN